MLRDAEAVLLPHTEGVGVCEGNMPVIVAVPPVAVAVGEGLANADTHAEVVSRAVPLAVLIALCVAKTPKLPVAWPLRVSVAVVTGDPVATLLGLPPPLLLTQPLALLQGLTLPQALKLEVGGIEAKGEGEAVPSLGDADSLLPPRSELVGAAVTLAASPLDGDGAAVLEAAPLLLSQKESVALAHPDSLLENVAQADPLDVPEPRPPAPPLLREPVGVVLELPLPRPTAPVWLALPLPDAHPLAL